MADVLNWMNDAITLVGKSLVHDEDNSGWHFSHGQDIDKATIPSNVKMMFDESELLAQIQSSFGNGVIITVKDMILYAEDEEVKIIPFENVEYIASLKATENDVEESVGLHTSNLLGVTEATSLMTKLFQSSSDRNKSITLQMNDGTTKYIEYPIMEDDNWGLNIGAVYGVIHAYMKRGPLMLADVDNYIKEQFEDALAKKDHYGSINFTFENATDWISFTNGNGGGFTNSGMQLDFVVGPDSLAVFGYVLLFESNQPIYVTKDALHNNTNEVKFNNIYEIYAERIKGSLLRGTSDTGRVVVSPENDEDDEFELVDDSFLEFDDDALADVIKKSIQFAR